MNILVYGAGVLGSLYATKLQQSGEHVTLLARGQRLIDLHEHGIALENVETRQKTTTAVHVVDRLLPEEAYDLVLVTVRKNQLPDILPVLAANRATPNVLFMVNNAAGPDALIKSLGRGRVILGFPGGGGARVGYVVQTYFDEYPLMPTMGEMDGYITPRLRHIAAMCEKAGMKVTLSRHMDAWLKTHVAVVSPLADAVYMAGGDIHILAHERHILGLMLHAIKEGFSVLRALEIPVTPFSLRMMSLVPNALLVPWLARRFNTKSAEVGIQYHANAARDEMKQLADEFKVLVENANIPISAIDCLRQSIAMSPVQRLQPTGV